MLRCMLIGGVIGVVSEFGARTLRLWIYRQPHYPIINVIVTFGIIMGAIASFVPSIGPLPAFAIAFVYGLAYEIANLRVLHWWDFPDERVGFIRGHAAIVVAIALLWGVVPLMIVAVQATLF
jgi:hypothetical protein